LKISAEYIWIDGTSPTKKLRTKNQILKVDERQDKKKGKTFAELSKSMDHQELTMLYFDQDWWMDEQTSRSNIDYLRNLVIPNWNFDGSSTSQAKTKPSDRFLVPVCATLNPLRDRSILVLCEVMGLDGKPHSSNTRHATAAAAEEYKDDDCWFGIEQEYNLFESGTLADIPLGWPERGPAPPQGKYYCGVGADEVHGYQISLDHEEACRDAGLAICGTNAEVMPGQWEFQIGATDALTTGDHLWLARYLLYRIASRLNAVVKLDPKPLSGDWNGTGAHVNVSTKAMREPGGLTAIKDAMPKLEARHKEHIASYGSGLAARLTGAHETCDINTFKWGVADRGASIRIPNHVALAKQGYFEDRRPGANIDPYEVITKIMNTICGTAD